MALFLETQQPVEPAVFECAKPKISESVSVSGDVQRPSTVSTSNDKEISKPFQTSTESALSQNVNDYFVVLNKGENAVGITQYSAEQFTGNVQSTSYKPATNFSCAAQQVVSTSVKSTVSRRIIESLMKQQDKSF